MADTERFGRDDLGSQLTARRAATALKILVEVDAHEAELTKLLTADASKIDLPKQEKYSWLCQQMGAKPGLVLNQNATLALPGMYVGGFDDESAMIIIQAVNGEEVLSIVARLNPETRKLEVQWTLRDDDAPGIESETLKQLHRNVTETLERVRALSSSLN